MDEHTADSQQDSEQQHQTKQQEQPQQPQYQQFQQQQQQFQQPYGQQYPPQYYNPAGAQGFYTPGGPVVVTVAQPAPSYNDPYPNFAAGDVKRIGGAMDSMGVIAIMLESIIVGLLSSYWGCSICYQGGYVGYWGGVAFIATGVLAHLLGRNPGRGLMMATLVAALVSFSCAVTLFAWSLDTFVDLLKVEAFSALPVITVCVLGKVIVGIVQFFLSIALAVKCGKGIFCSSKVSAAATDATQVQNITVQGTTQPQADQ